MKTSRLRDFTGRATGGPVAKTLRSQCWGVRVQSLVRELEPTHCNLEFTGHG